MAHVLGICPWCLVEVRMGATGGMQPSMQTLVIDEPTWWHQGCFADMSRSEWNWVTA